jgi:hypothetical protein
MPEYHNYKNYRDRSIKVSPVGLWRLFRKWPYFVGDRVVLRISYNQISADSKKDILGNLVFSEIHPDGHKVGHDAIELEGKNNVIRLESNKISRQGDFAIYLGNISGHDLSAPIFTTEIMHRDRRRYDLFLLFIGALISFACVIIGWLLGLFQKLIQ